MSELRPLNPAALKMLHARGITDEVIERMGIYTARRAPKPDPDDPDPDKEPIPDVEGNVVCYPYHDTEDNEINAKFVVRQRNGDKLYWQRPGVKKTFYNYQIMTDRLLKSGEQALLVVEGENDCLAGLSAEYPWTVSVPAGGDPAVHPETGLPIPMKPDEELDPANDVKFEYIVNCWDQLAEIKRIIIWTDWDAVGDRLRAEIARRVGKVRCAHVPQPPDIAANLCIPFEKRDKKTGKVVAKGMRACKDLNEVLIHYGAERVLAIINGAKMMPVSGLYQLSDFEPVNRELFSTGFPQLDPYFKLWRGAFVVSSGLPMSGKSALWNQIAFNMAFNHYWRVALASFEAEVHPDLIRALRAFYLQKDYREWSNSDKADADAWVQEHFVFITRDPQGLDDTLCTVEWIVERLEDAVIRYGISMVIIDPWNQIDHQRRPGERGDEYLTRSIKAIKDTGKRLQLCTVIIAHPDKGAGKESIKEGKPMTLYDMADGAAWNNAAEIGVIVFRGNMRDVETRVVTRKIKFRGTGQVGDAILIYDTLAELFDTSISMVGREKPQMDPRYDPH